MNDEERNGLRKQRRLARDKCKKLQSNWNSLREYLIQLQKLKGINQQCFSWGVAQEILDKMNELESGEKN